MWVTHVVNRFNLVLMLQLLCVLPESMIRVRAQNVCEVGQEKEGTRWRWVLPYRDPCLCTKVRFGGSNINTPTRPFNPVYVDKPLVGDDVRKIREHYSLNCTDHDECTSSTDNCDTNAACTNTAGSFVCACNVGYRGDGVTCTAICTQDCQNDGICKAPDICTCSPCYTGAICESVFSGTPGPLGLEDGSVTENQFTASSTWPAGDIAPYKGRLNNAGFWAASSRSLPCWLQVDFLSPVVITGIKTQGATRVGQWIKTFQVKFGTDVNGLNDYTLSNVTVTFTANTDRTTVVDNYINQAIARYFRVVILTFEWHPDMRMEVIGYRCI
ncbi:EGF-like repeat and discoidin I-like domain-containing protein 3 [Amphiura filiformis]|uniref:EGF-like repeat and discoidin I-like domain-containing protein 3 n=1 Tax=Amphiura filiformis TaxID=82378 RepID=UPI003B21481D